MDKTANIGYSFRKNIKLLKSLYNFYKKHPKKFKNQIASITLEIKYVPFNHRKALEQMFEKKNA